jgi:acyl carrier protein
VTDLIPTVEKVWQEVLGLDAIDHDADFINDLAGDSMFAVEIGAKLREILQVDVPLDLPYVAPTVSSAARYIESVLAHEPPGRSVAD